MKLKYLFFTFLLLTIIAFWMMRRHQFNFESEKGIKFNVMEFELPGSAGRLNELITYWAEPEKKEFVMQQLKLDYFFMSTLFPSIFILCMWARQKLQALAGQNKSPKAFSSLKILLLLLALLQILALFFDISENLRLTQWIQQGFAGNMLLFETLVKLKFVFAISGFLIGLVLLVFAQMKVRKA